MSASKLGRDNTPMLDTARSSRALICQNLANSLKARHEQTGDVHLLEELIDVEREALSLSPVGHPDRAISLQNLAAVLKLHYDQRGDAKCLQEAIELENEALTLCPPDHPKRAVCCVNLAHSFWTQYQFMGDLDILDRALQLQREAVSLCPVGHPDRALACAHLAGSLGAQYEIIGDISLLEEAIEFEREALSLRPVGHPNRAVCCSNLAVSLRIYYECAGNVDLLDESIDLEREALAMRPTGHIDRSTSCTNLANCIGAKYECTGDILLLDQTIDLEREALSLRPNHHPDRVHSCSNLGVALVIRYERTGDLFLLDEAIDLHRDALSLCPISHPDHARFCTNLAIALSTRYEHIGDLFLLDEAISLNRKALSLHPSGHPDRPNSCANLAAALTTQYERVGEIGVLNEVVMLERESLSLRQIGHPDRWQSCSNLARTLFMLNSVSRNVELVKEAHALLIEAIQLSPPQDVWVHACDMSNLHLEDAVFYDADVALQYLSKSVEHEPGRPFEAASRIVYSLRLMSQFIESMNGSKTNYHASLILIYDHTVQLLPLLINLVLGSNKQLHMLIECSQLGVDAFVNAVCAGSYTSGLESLEIVQAAFWSQKLYLRDPQLQDVPGELALELEQLVQDLRIQSSIRANAPEQTRATSQDIDFSRSDRLYALIREIRTYPGLKRFMLGETYQTLLTVASDSHPVVVLVGAQSHFYALIVTSSQANDNTILPLDLEQAQLERILYKRGTRRSHRGVSAPNDEPALKEDLLDVEEIIGETHLSGKRGMRALEANNSTPLGRHLKYIWLRIVKPILDQLGIVASDTSIRPRLHWCPTGVFSAIPLHAAGLYDGPRMRGQCCADYVVSSYIPTLTSLLRARATIKEPLPWKGLSLALIAEKTANDPNFSVIPHVEAEISAIISTVNTHGIQVGHHQVGATTIAGTSDAMKAANIVHLACHGVQDADDATQSGFCLGDGRLTISHLMELHIKEGFLAFLSACETATGSKEQPDQVMHLAAAMLFAGFKNVVATMWAIADEDGPRVAKWFYEALFANETVDADAVACALDAAVGKLRDSGVPAERWVPFIHMGA